MTEIESYFIRKQAWLDLLDEHRAVSSLIKRKIIYDYYFRIVKSKKFRGSSTKQNELVGIVESGGFSSKISFFEHLKEETKIRMKNNQNMILVILIYLNALIKHILKKF